MPDVFELHYLHSADFPNPIEETVALYRNGQLVAIDIQPKIVARAIQMLDMKKVYNSKMLLGQETLEGAAQTTAEIDAFAQALKDEEAAVLRQQAAELVARAEALENGDSN